ncbi:hypothetical protein HDV05_007268 [Chytridiales sp. JEL 0842]|nr:hypothetical protein HDV05_007268 [Chytridiales sp. JEL 0842]
MPGPSTYGEKNDASSLPLPSGWAQHWDQNYEAYYYVDPNGESTWYDPRTTKTQEVAELKEEKAVDPNSTPTVIELAHNPQYLPLRTFEEPEEYIEPTPSSPHATPVFTTFDPSVYPTPPTFGIQQQQPAPNGIYTAPPNQNINYEPNNGAVTPTAPLLAPPPHQEESQLQAHANAIYQSRLAPTYARNHQGDTSPAASAAVVIPTTVSSSSSSPVPKRESSASKPDSAYTSASSLVLKERMAEARLTRQRSKKAQNRRFCCGCFRTRRGCCTVWILITLLILGGLGVATWLLWPKQPSVTVSDPYARQGIQTVTQTGSFLSASPQNPFVLSLNLAVDLNVYSPNKVDIVVNRVSFTGNLIDEFGNRIADSQVNGIATNINFKANTNTTFTLPFTISHTLTTPLSSLPTLLTSDTTFALLARKCGVFNPSSDQDIVVGYRTELDIQLIMITKSLASNGARVYITSTPPHAPDLQLATDLRALGMDVHGLVQTLETKTDCMDLASTLRSLEESRGNVPAALHVLVNNHGTAWAAPLEEFPEEKADLAWRSNVSVPFYLSVGCLGMLKEGVAGKGWARVVNVGSLGGTIVSESDVAFLYKAAKAGVHHLTKILAAQWGKDGITVNCIAPGLFPSRTAKYYINDKERSQKILKSIPMSRFGEEADVGALAVFLASRASGYMTGTVLHLDGGGHMQSQKSVEKAKM